MRILVVEDDSRMAELLRRGLASEGHNVDVAHDGVKGLEKARQNPFDALVLDVMLPGIDGLALARRLRATGSRVPILMLTARDATQDVVRGLDSGADDYLTKPFSFEVL
ncbi:MAG TPA: response regulator, partial [Bryobacteraceae bacterium]